MPLKIIVVKDKSLNEFLITQELTTIGRRSGSDISIKDPSISGNHAKIQKVSDNYLIQDLNSTNGLYLMGRKIKQHIIKDNDVVVIGEHKLKFSLVADTENLESTLVASAKEEESGLVRDDTTKITNKGVLTVMTGPDAGQIIALHDALTTIGVPGIQIAAVSRRPQGHFIIHVDGGKDKDQLPLVNDVAIGFKSRQLDFGDMIEVAGIRMQYKDGQIK